MTQRIRFIWMFALLALFAYINKIEFIIFCFHRTEKEQKELFEEGKTKCDGVKKKSRHQNWRAIDLVVIEDGKCIWHGTSKYELLGRFWKLLGGTWGHDWYKNKETDFDDIYHFEV